MPLCLVPSTDAAQGGPLSIDLTGILPERLAPLSLDEVRQLSIRADERSYKLGDAFRVSGSAADGRIECRGDFSRVHSVAAGMGSGRITVRGNVGRHAAEGMTGGHLEIDGDAGDWLACEMAGGRVHVAGRTGDNLAAALPGSDAGLQGGIVVVAGDAGHLAGARMRRGILAIGGSCGEAAGFEMRSGILVVGGRSGRHPGLGMRRGSIVFLAERPEVPACFRRGTTWNPPFLAILLRRLARVGFKPATPLPSRWRQWHGDMLAGGRGEILHPGRD